MHKRLSIVLVTGWAMVATPGDPVENRCSSGSEASEATAGEVARRGRPDPAGCSLTVPQSPQTEHRPDHWAEGRPQLAHTNIRFSLPTTAL